MMQIPAAAMPVVEILRRDVPKPMDWDALGLFHRGERRCCPVGLHPQSTSGIPNPAGAAHDIGVSADAAQAFFKWYGGRYGDQEHLRSYIDAIWPEPA
jgi:hypothetical protein